MLDQYISECMVSKNLPMHGYQNCNTSQILIFGKYVKVKQPLYTQVNIWVGTILKYIDTIVRFYLSKKVLAWCINLNCIENKDAIKYS